MKTLSKSYIIWSRHTDYYAGAGSDGMIYDSATAAARAANARNDQYYIVHPWIPFTNVDTAANEVATLRAELTALKDVARALSDTFYISGQTDVLGRPFAYYDPDALATLRGLLDGKTEAE